MKYITSTINYLYELRGIKSITLSTIVIALVLLLLYIDLSPLYGALYKGDQQCFHIMGYAWHQGHIPYVDYFDHKGPLLYSIYLLGSIILPKTTIGMYIVTIIVMAILYYISKQIAHLLNINGIRFYLCIFTSLVFIFITGGKGAPTCETISLPFQLIPLALLVKDTKLKLGNPILYTFVYGCCLAALTLIRLNNISINISILLVLIINNLHQKEYKKILWHGLTCICGFFVVLLPYVIYFILHDAIEDFIYANFIFNMQYKSNFMTYANVFNIPTLVIYGIVSTLLVVKNNNIIITSVFASSVIINTIVYWSGCGYLHYYEIYLPLLLIGMLIASQSYSSIFKTLFIVSLYIILPFCNIAYHYFKAYHTTSTVENKNEGIKIVNDIDDNNDKVQNVSYRQMSPIEKINSVIPIEERKSICNINNFSLENYFQHENILPINKYFNCTDIMMQIGGDKVINEMMDELNDKKPLWILSQTNNKGRIYEHINTYYSKIDSIPDYNLYIYKRIGK